MGFWNDSYYAFVAPQSGTYRITLGSPTTDVEWDLYTGSDFSTGWVDSCDTYWNSTTESCTSNLTGGTTYYLRVSQWGLTGGTFVLNISIIGSEGSVSSPVTLTVGTAHAGSVGMAGISYYRFTATQNGSHSVGITNIVGDYYSLTMKVYATPFGSPTMTTLQTCSTSYNAVCTVNGLSAGTTYYIEVDGSTYSGATYTITVTEGVSQGSVASPVDLAVDPVTAHEGAVDGNAYSYYRFTTLAEAGEYFVNLSGSSVNVSVYTGSDFSTGSVTSCYAQTQCRLNGLNAQTPYYVKVSNSTASDLTYQISVTRGLTEGSTAQPVELTIDTPHSAVINTTAYAYYSFQTTAFAGSYTISLTGVQKDLQWQLYTSLSSYSPLMTCDVNPPAVTDEVCVTSNLNPNTTYYLKVYNKESTAESAYVLEVSEGGGSEGAVNYPKGLGSVPVTGLAYTGQVRYQGYSYYSFTTGNAALYVVSLKNLQADLGWSLFTTESFSYSLFSSDRYTDATDEVYSTQSLSKFFNDPTPGTLAGGTTYYLRIDNSSATITSAFDLTLMPLDPAAGCDAAATECIDFESGLLPAGLTQTTNDNGNAWKWVIDPTSAGQPGNYSVRSGTLRYPTWACFQYTPATRPNWLTYSLFTQGGSVDMKISEGGTAVSNTWGLSPWAQYSIGAWKRVTYPLPAGTAPLTFEWCWSMDTSTGTPAIWIDDIEFR